MINHSLLIAYYLAVTTAPGPSVPGGVPEYDPAQVRANNLSRAEALMTQQQRLQQPQQF